MAFRRPKGNYTVVANQMASDTSISYACRGMLLYLLSKPEDWEGHNADIERAGGPDGIGKHARRNLIIEAEDAGYLRYVKAHEGGRLNCWYEVQMEPLPIHERTQSARNNELKPTSRAEIQPPGFQRVEKQPAVKQLVENQGGIESKETAIKELPSKVGVVPPPASFQAIQEKTRLPSESVAFLLSVTSPSPSLVLAGLAAWVEACGKKRSDATKDAVGWLRGVYTHPERFGLLQNPDGTWWYPQQVKARMPSTPAAAPPDATTLADAAERKRWEQSCQDEWSGLLAFERAAILGQIVEQGGILAERAIGWRARDPELNTIPLSLLGAIQETRGATCE